MIPPNKPHPRRAAIGLTVEKATLSPRRVCVDYGDGPPGAWLRLEAHSGGLGTSESGACQSEPIGTARWFPHEPLNTWEMFCVLGYGVCRPLRRPGRTGFTLHPLLPVLTLLASRSIVSRQSLRALRPSLSFRPLRSNSSAARDKEEAQKRKKNRLGLGHGVLSQLEVKT